MTTEIKEKQAIIVAEIKERLRRHRETTIVSIDTLDSFKEKGWQRTSDVADAIAEDASCDWLIDYKNHEVRFFEGN